jgi:hypothetical protein
VSAGALFTHWIADSLTLWKSPVTDQNLWIAAAYYSIIARAPPQIFWALSAVVTLGGTTLLWSLNDFRAGNIMFDGGSICKLHFTIAMQQLSDDPTCYQSTVLFGTVVAIYLTTIFPSTLCPLVAEHPRITELAYNNLAFNQTLPLSSAFCPHTH